MQLPTDKSSPVYSTDGDYRKVLRLMRAVALAQSNGRLLPDVLRAINAGPDLDGLVKFCAFLYVNCPFVPHLGKQDVRTLNAMLADRRGNCVEYTTAIGSFCAAAGIPCTFRSVSFSTPRAFTHVFPLVEGMPFDLVIGQEPPNKNFVMNLGTTKNYRYFSDLKVCN
jgi:hypothetical protein